MFPDIKGHAVFLARTKDPARSRGCKYRQPTSAKHQKRAHARYGELPHLERTGKEANTCFLTSSTSELTLAIDDKRSRQTTGLDAPF
jgi:hypothetical protein